MIFLYNCKCGSSCSRFKNNFKYNNDKNKTFGEPKRDNVSSDRSEKEKWSYSKNLRHNDTYWVEIFQVSLRTNIYLKFCEYI